MKTFFITNKGLLSKLGGHLKREFQDVENDYLSFYSDEVRYELSANGKMKKAKRKSFAWVVRNTINAIKHNLSKYSEGNPTMYFEDIDIALCKKYNISQDIVNHLITILPNYYNLDLSKYTL